MYRWPAVEQYVRHFPKELQEYIILSKGKKFIKNNKYLEIEFVTWKKPLITYVTVSSFPPDSSIKDKQMEMEMFLTVIKVYLYFTFCCLNILTKQVSIYLYESSLTGRMRSWKSNMANISNYSRFKVKISRYITFMYKILCKSGLWKKI